MSLMKIINKEINEIIPYKNNPRYNKNSIEEVAESIKEFGFRVPILLDENNVIICGHTRYEASKLLNLKDIPCVIVRDLTEEQVKAFRLADNKVAEFSKWNYEKLEEELENINTNLMAFGFYNELDVTDDDFVKDTEITKEKKEKEYICPNCGEKFK